MDYKILVITCVIALITVILNLVVIENNPYLLLKVVVSVLVSLTAMRYITLIVYASEADYDLLNSLKYFYFASSIGITMTTASAVWFIIPDYRQKIKYPYFLLGFLPWIIFYVYLIVMQPTKIIQGSQFGYVLSLIGKFPIYLSIAQGSFIVIMISLCIKGMITYKHLQIRVQLLLIILSQLLLALDGFGYQIVSVKVFHPFTLTEAFALAATYFAFSKSIRAINALKNE